MSVHKRTGWKAVTSHFEVGSYKEVQLNEHIHIKHSKRCRKGRTKAESDEVGQGNIAMKLSIMSPSMKVQCGCNYNRLGFEETRPAATVYL